MRAQTVLVLGGLDLSLLNFRGPLLRAMVQAGHTVIGGAPAETPSVPPALSRMGVRFVPMPMVRAGLNPLVDALNLLRLISLCRNERPDVVLCYTIKPVIYGSLAAGWAGVPKIYALITGLGAAFYSAGIKGRILRFTAVVMYRWALARCTKVLVQNQEIAELFIREGIVEATKIVVVAGSGVDVQHFHAAPAPAGPPVFLLLARMLHDKGIEEYVTAARSVKQQMPAARFLLVGDSDPNPAAISKNQLDQWSREGVVEYCPAVSDVRPLLAGCSVYVLPSYHEGMPRSVLEAMASGRPIITTDTIGCRETIAGAGLPDQAGIRTGENGMLVPVRSIDSLAAAMLRLAMDVGLQVQMGRRGREIVEARFDVHLINDQMLRTMGLLPDATAKLS